MVPNGWSEIKLGKLTTTVTSGSRDWAQDYAESGSKFIRMTNLNRDGIYLLLDDLKFVSITSISSDGRRTALQAGDILCSITAELGKIGWIPDEFGEAYINQHTALIRIDGKKADSKFIAYQLSSIRLNKIINSLNDAGAKSGLNLPTIKSIPIYYPPLPEQKKIAQILSTWDQAITATEQLLANSQQQKKALMQQLLTGKKRLLDNNGVVFSGEWGKYCLEELGNTFTGLAGKSKEDFGKGKPYIPYMNIFKNCRIDIDNLDFVHISLDENQNSVQYGDIFFTTSSETPDEVGMSSVLLDVIEEVYLNSFCFGYRLNNFTHLLPEFACHILRGSEVRKQISVLGQGATRYNLSKKQLMKLELILPTINEQRKIATVLSTADQEIEALQKKLACLKQEKKALMQQLLTGKRRVKVTESTGAN